MEKETKMNHPQLSHDPVAKAEMLIHKPVAEVFAAFVDPAITSQFWFTKGSGRLDTQPQVQWDWEMFGASAQVRVKALEPNQRILIEWGGAGEPTTTVEWRFTQLADNTTFVSITNSGFVGNGDELVQQVIGATEGFTLVLAGAKALLEHNIQLNLAADRFPQGLEAHEATDNYSGN
jgi:uncharacterized protein YndB with AHSA1/START domain